MPESSVLSVRTTKRLFRKQQFSIRHPMPDFMGKSAALQFCHFGCSHRKKKNQKFIFRHRRYRPAVLSKESNKLCRKHFKFTFRDGDFLSPLCIHFYRAHCITRCLGYPFISPKWKNISSNRRTNERTECRNILILNKCMSSYVKRDIVVTESMNLRARIFPDNNLRMSSSRFRV